MIDTNGIGAFGYVVALVVFGLLTILLLGSWNRSDQSRLPALAVAISIVWAGVWIAGFLDFTRSITLVTIAEWARGLAWLGASIAILREVGRNELTQRLKSGYGIFVILLAALPVGYFLLRSNVSAPTTMWFAGGYVISLLVVLTAEQLYRNSPVDSHSGVTYICIAIAGVFLFDLCLYSLAIAGAVTDSEYWAARGFVNALFAVPLVLGIWRRSHASPVAQVPPQIVFYSLGITIIAIYIVLVLAGQHYVESYGGDWSAVGSIVLVAAALMAAVVVLASVSIRARVRVTLMKTFLQYKYDYRKEWLRFIATLSESGMENVAATAVRAIAQIVDSPGGIVWIQEQETKAYVPTGSWRSAIPNVAPIVADSGLTRFLQDRQWIIDLEERKQYPDRYDDLRLEDWLIRDSDWWLIVPLFLGKRLYGFVVLQRPRVVPSLNFEDHDLLRTVGRHVGAHINQAESDKRLAESQQFGAYNRLTAFLMHDLNNLIAQQSLVVKNAERFRQNPKFVDDAIDTIANSVARMKRLMEQLSSGSKPPSARRTDVRDALKRAVARCTTRDPKPRLEITDTPLLIQADSERLTGAFEHLIRNAQDATPPNGYIDVTADAKNGVVNVAISDTGKGMSPEFIRERLFRPFDSTKGSESMGIGAYQAREYFRNLGGQMEVTSTVGTGTIFNVRLSLLGE